MNYRKVLAFVSAAAVALVSGCGSMGQPSSPVHSSTPSAVGKITVYAAASLKKSFTAIGEQLKTANPGASVEFSFGGSSDLVTQLIQGAPGDLFASADTANMTKVS